MKYTNTKELSELMHQRFKKGTFKRIEAAMKQMNREKPDAIRVLMDEALKARGL